MTLKYELSALSYYCADMWCCYYKDQIGLCAIQMSLPYTLLLRWILDLRKAKIHIWKKGMIRKQPGTKG